jgi:hypothetical protein
MHRATAGAIGRRPQWVQATLSSSRPTPCSRRDWRAARLRVTRPPKSLFGIGRWAWRHFPCGAHGCSFPNPEQWCRVNAGELSTKRSAARQVREPSETKDEHRTEFDSAALMRRPRKGEPGMRYKRAQFPSSYPGLAATIVAPTGSVFQRFCAQMQANGLLASVVFLTGHISLRKLSGRIFNDRLISSAQRYRRWLPDSIIIACLPATPETYRSRSREDAASDRWSC